MKAVALDELTDALAQAHSYCALHQRLGARAEHPFSPLSDVLLNACMALNLTLYAEFLGADLRQAAGAADARAAN